MAVERIRFVQALVFFDHMLTALSRHSFIDMKLKVDGDLEVDTHHTIEDTGIVIGEAIRKALGDKMGIRRYGSCILPMDEALVLCAVDLSDRPYLQYDLQLDREFCWKFRDRDGERIFLCPLLLGKNELTY